MGERKRKGREKEEREMKEEKTFKSGKVTWEFVFAQLMHDNNSVTVIIKIETIPRKKIEETKEEGVIVHHEQDSIKSPNDATPTK